jgi:hypothetical protein
LIKKKRYFYGLLGMRYIKNTIIVAILFSILVSNSSGQGLESQKEALHIIADFANSICGSIPLEGTQRTTEVSGEVKTELSKILKKIVDLGVEGAAKYQGGGYSGVLQADLFKALNESTNCKLKVFNDLQNKLLEDDVVKSKPLKKSQLELESERMKKKLSQPVKKQHIKKPFQDEEKVEKPVEQIVEKPKPIPPEAEQASGKAREAQAVAKNARTKALEAATQARISASQARAEVDGYHSYTNGDYHYEGGYLNGQRNGYGVSSWNDGRHYEGERA